MEMMKLDFNPVVRNIRSNDLYFYEGGNKFKNIRTDKSGEVSDDAARKTFVINLECTILFNEYPMLSKMVKKLDLIFDNNKK